MAEAPLLGKPSEAIRPYLARTGPKWSLALKLIYHHRSQDDRYHVLHHAA